MDGGSKRTPGLCSNVMERDRCGSEKRRKNGLWSGCEEGIFPQKVEEPVECSTHFPLACDDGNGWWKSAQACSG